MSFGKGAKMSVLVVVAAVAVAQAFRIERTNPPAHSEIQADPAIRPLLKRACYDCHSNETAWPWYSNVAPVSWLVGSDVDEGRRHLNFSEWGTYSGDARAGKLEEIAEELQEGAMPPWYYSVMHADARLTPEERVRIINWARGPSGPSGLFP